MTPITAVDEVDEVVTLARDLIRIDTSNTGDSSTTVGDLVGPLQVGDVEPLLDGPGHRDGRLRVEALTNPVQQPG